MKKLFLFVFLLLFRIASSAHGADLCNAGYYLNTETGQCAQCGAGYYYCPGDNIRHSCPTTNVRLMSDWPEDYHNPVLADHYFYTDSSLRYQVQDRASHCSVYYALESKYGVLYDIRQYNPQTDLYESATASYGWIQPYPGHYLLNPKVCGAWDYYYNAATCPAGAYCPGEPHRRCVQTATYGLYTCGDNSYSDAGASECTPCPIGTGNSGNNTADHASVESCKPLPLCTAGATRLHAGAAVFNIWPNDKCTSPALRIRLPGGVCCVNLATGTGNGINIPINDSIYHTVNFN